jgi:hypothetical protein
VDLNADVVGETQNPGTARSIWVHKINEVMRCSRLTPRMKIIGELSLVLKSPVKSGFPASGALPDFNWLDVFLKVLKTGPNHSFTFMCVEHKPPSPIPGTTKNRAQVWPVELEVLVTTTMTQNCHPELWLQDFKI